MIDVNFNYNSSIYSKSSNSFVKLSQRELAKEDIEDLPYFEVSKNGGYTKEKYYQIAFRDTNNDENIITFNLKEKTLQKLVSHFGKDNFFVKDDGTIRLTEEAESFVSGWYDNIVDDRQGDLSGVDMDLEYTLSSESEISNARGKIDEKYYSLSKMRSLSGEITEEDLKGLKPEQIKALQPLIDKANISVDYYRMMVNLFNQNGSSGYTSELDAIINDDFNFDGTIDFRENLSRSIYDMSAEEFMSKIFEKHKEKYEREEGTVKTDAKKVEIFNFQDKDSLMETIKELKKKNKEEEIQDKEDKKKILIEEASQEIINGFQTKHTARTLDLIREFTDGFTKDMTDDIYTKITDKINQQHEEEYANIGDFLARNDFSKEEIIANFEGIRGGLESDKNKSVKTDELLKKTYGVNRQFNIEESTKKFDDAINLTSYVITRLA